MKKIIVILLIAIAAFGLLFGCSSAPTGGNSLTDFNSNTTLDSNKNPVNNNSNQASSDFKSMIVGLPNYYVSYDMISPGQNATLKEWVKNDKIKQEIITSENTATMYFVNNKITTCTNANGEEMCFEMPGAKLTSTGIDTAKEKADIWASMIVLAPTRTIAGVTASCFSVNEDGFNYTYCFSPDAVPIFVEAQTSQGTTTMIATEYSKIVDDSVFNVPAAQEIPIPGYN